VLLSGLFLKQFLSKMFDFVLKNGILLFAGDSEGYGFVRVAP
jgi:hypothetical protein